MMCEKYCDEIFPPMRAATKEEQQAIYDYIQGISKDTGLNIFDKKTILERLEEFIEYINVKINTEYEKLPASTEDEIRKKSYCLALKRCRDAIQNIIDGHDFNYVEK